jgi:hypothetical protein
MPIPKPPLDKLQRCADEIAIACGNLSQAAVALGVTRSTAQHWRKLCAEYGIEPKVKAQTPEQMRARIQVLERDLAALKAQPPSPEYKLPPVKDRPKDRPNRDAAQVRRHFYIPDTQVRPGVPLDHIGWVAQALVDYAPDEICHLGDHWDFPSLNSHVQPGAAPLEGARYQDDLEAGNAAFARLCAPMEAQLALKGNKWKPRKRFLAGNHEDRADRVATNDPRWMGHVGSNNCQVRDWEWVPFLKRSNADGIMASHYFASQHSKFPVGGEVSNRLNKIGQSFIQGHEQGFRYGNKVLGNGQTIHGIVAGSCLTPDHRVLTSDLLYVPLGDIKIGNTLVSFDEMPGQGGKRSRRYKTGTVEAIKRDYADCFEVTLGTGKIFKVTADHLWLTRKQGTTTGWLRTDQLVLNNGRTHVPILLDEWTPSCDYDSGWLSKWKPESLGRMNIARWTPVVSINPLGRREIVRIAIDAKTMLVEGYGHHNCYLHIEDYRGRQNQRHWRGIVVLNEVENGDLCIMPLSLKYLCRKYEGVDLYAYMSKKYPDGDWEHLI